MFDESSLFCLTGNDLMPFKSKKSTIYFFTI